MENVEGFLTAKKGEFLAEAVYSFIKAGYWVKVEKINAAYQGIPQYRRRVFTVGNLLGMDFDFPEPTHSPEKPSRRFPLPNSIEARRGEVQPNHKCKPLVTLNDAISNLPAETKKEPITAPFPLTEFQTLIYRKGPLFHHVGKDPAPNVLERMKLLQPGQRMSDLPDFLQHPSFNNRAHRRVMDGTPTEKRGGPPAGLIRLNPDQPSLTISSIAQSEFVHPKYNRLLTLRECARIQTFADDFIFMGSRSSIALQIANAVPPLYMKALVEQIMKYDSASVYVGNLRWLGIKATYAYGISPTLKMSLNVIEQKARETLE